MANQTERVDHVAAALRYASQGVPVFPLAPRSKFPLISGANDGHGLHDATTDAARIQAWWMAHPTANIGGSKELRVSSPTTYGRAALRRELERLSQAEEGTRNDSLNRAAFSLGRLVGTRALDHEETTAALMAEGHGSALEPLSVNGPWPVGCAEGWSSLGASVSVRPRPA
jgi:hypothetical protein